MENEHHQRISGETNSSPNALDDQAIESHPLPPSASLPPRATKTQRRGLFLRRWLFEEDRGLSWAMRTFFAAAVAAHQSVSSVTPQNRRHRVRPLWANLYRRIGCTRARGSAILAGLKDPFHPFRSFSRLATNSYAAGALAIIVLFLVFLGFAGGHGIAGNRDRNHNTISKESNSSEPFDENVPTTDSLLPGAPVLGPLIAESRPNFDYAFAALINRAAPRSFVERRDDPATSASGSNTGASAGSAASPFLYASLGGGGAPGAPAPAREVVASSVPETGASFWLLGFALALICLTRHLLVGRGPRRDS